MSDHAVISPSGASGWMACSRWASDPKGSKFADEGTAAHILAARALFHKRDALFFLDEQLQVGERIFVVNQEMAAYVQVYLDLVRRLAEGKELLIEQRVDMTSVVPECWGTSDVVILGEDELTIVDLKYGRGVQVDAVENPQLRLYGLGTLATFGVLGDFQRVRMVICQPRLDHISEEVITRDELFAFGMRAAAAARVALGPVEQRSYNPGEKQCRWCAAKATCPALAKEVSKSTGADFEDLTQTVIDTPLLESTGGPSLAAMMLKVDLIEDWCKAVRARTESELLAGNSVPGWKLVEGRRGNRRWSDAAAVEELFKSFRLKQEEMYSFELISPAVAEKLLKKESPKRWTKAEALVTQSEGKPSVAPETDKRAAYVPVNVEQDFAVLDEAAA